MQRMQFKGSFFLIKIIFFVCLSELGFGSAVNETLRSDGTVKASYLFLKDSKDGYPGSDSAITALVERPLGDKIRILPIPLLLSSHDYQLIQRGARQRALALAAFFQDVIHNEGAKVLGSGLLSRDQLIGIFETEGEYSLSGLREIYKNRREAPSFFYGPDVIRDPSGQFVVIEDNVGPIGGLADVAATHDSFHSANGRSKSSIPFLETLIRDFLSDIPESDWANSVVALYREDSDSTEGSEAVLPEDDEDHRLVKVLNNLKINIIKGSELKKSKLDDLVSGKYKKVINFSDIMNATSSWRDRARMFNAFSEGKFDLMMGPGMDVVGNKALLPIVDRLVTLYLGERPILKTPETEWLTDPNQVEPGWVIKKVNGQQGNSVYIVDSLTDQNRLNLKYLMDDWGVWGRVQKGIAVPHFVRQRFVDQSYLPAALPDSWLRFNVDMRPLTYFQRGDVKRPSFIWGRANLKMGGVLTNVSQGGFELYVNAEQGCESLLRLVEPENSKAAE